jgi:hypothetical protein
MAAHSKIVGGSSASRVLNCPGSVELVNLMPAKPSSSYADTGTLCHDVISQVLSLNYPPEVFLGKTFNDAVLTEELIEDKIRPALEALEEIDPNHELEFAVETYVGFGDLLPGVFGSADVIGKMGNRAIILDWKFGDGIAVSAENNSQLLFYAAACLYTESAQWIFDHGKITEVELIIVQPGRKISRWVTDVVRLRRFVAELKAAVELAQRGNAPLKAGDHCRWCAARPVCPILTGEAERMLKLKLSELNEEQIGQELANAELLKGWISDLYALAMQMAENGVRVPGWKLVQKKANREWVDESNAIPALIELGVPMEDLIESNLRSPAQIEKILKRRRASLPDGLVTKKSSGITLAPKDDPREEATTDVSARLRAAFKNI